MNPNHQHPSTSAPPNKRKRKRDERNQREALKSFWDSNYEYKSSDQTINTDNVYSLFMQLNPDVQIHPCTFRQKSVELGVRKNWQPRQKPFYLATPTSKEACNHHKANAKTTANTESIVNCEFLLMNIQGIITNKKNKSEFRNAMVDSPTLVTPSHHREPSKERPAPRFGNH